MRYLALFKVLDLHRRIIEQSGGGLGIRDLGLLKSAIAQPRMTFDNEALYPTVIDKAVTLGFSIIIPLLMETNGLSRCNGNFSNLKWVGN